MDLISFPKSPGIECIVQLKLNMTTVYMRDKTMKYAGWKYFKKLFVRSRVPPLNKRIKWYTSKARYPIRKNIAKPKPMFSHFLT